MLMQPNPASRGAAQEAAQPPHFHSLGLIMFLARTLAVLVALPFCAGAALSQADLYTVSSKAQGASFDLVVTEIKRDPRRSYLRVPGFHTRTAPGARWLMCAYTDLSIKRGFSHWAVMYPEERKDVLVVGFSNSASTSPKEIFGQEFDKVRLLGDDMMPVTKFLAFCGMKR